MQPYLYHPNLILHSEDFPDVSLRPITAADTEQVLSWRNDPFVVENFIYRKPISKAEHLDWLTKKVYTGAVYQFLILYKETPVGCIYLQHFDAERNAMESGIFCSPSMPRRQGIATTAETLLKQYASDSLHLDRLFARVLSENTASNRLHPAAGYHVIPPFEGEGEVEIDGRKHQVIFYEANLQNE